MNNFHPESLLELAKQRSRSDVDWCLVRRRPLFGNFAQLGLVTLGGWLVAAGEKLQALQPVSLQAKLAAPHSKTWKAGF